MIPKKPKPVAYAPRKADTAPLKEVIDQMLNTYKLRKKFNETHIIASWERIMGKTIASRTTKLFIKDGRMYVKLSSAPLKSELNMSKTKVIELLNKDLGERVVEEIVFM